MDSFLLFPLVATRYFYRYLCRVSQQVDLPVCQAIWYIASNSNKAYRLLLINLIVSAAACGYILSRTSEPISLVLHLFWIGASIWCYFNYREARRLTSLRMVFWTGPIRVALLIVLGTLIIKAFYGQVHWYSVPIVLSSTIYMYLLYTKPDWEGLYHG